MKQSKLLTKHQFTYGEVPGSVQSLQITHIRQWGFTASWDPPTSGTSPVLYNVSISNGNNGEVYEMQFIPNSHGAYVIDHLYDDTLYIFGVTAVDVLDSAGPSTFSTVFIPSCALCIIRSESGHSFVKMSLSPLAFPAVVSGKAVDSADAADAREANLPAGFKEVLISGLQPGVLYQFDVKNVDTEEVVDMSRYRVFPDPVENLQIRLVSTTSCIATYEPPATDTGQKIDGYRIVSSPTNSTSDSVITIRNKSQTSLLIENLEPGIEYTIEVQTFSGEIANLLYSSPKNATVVRADFAMVENTNTSITTQWEIPRDGNHVGFQLHYGVANTSEVNNLSLNASSSTSTISGLQPGQKYQVDLYLVSHEGLKSFYSSAVFQTEPNAVSIITGTSTATSISLTWNHPLGGADSYIIEYNSLSPTAPLVTDRQSVIIRRLSPGAVYELNITTVYGIARSSPTTAYFLTDSLSEGEMEVHSVTSDSIGVTWGAMPDTLDVKYIFAISPSEGHRIEEISNHRVEFVNLTSGRLFTISLLSRSSLDSEDYNGSFIQQRTLPAAPYSVAITPLEPIDYFALHVSWMLPPTGDWDRIRVTITQVAGPPDYVLVGKMDTSFVIKPLLQDTFYAIGVTTVSGLDDTQQESEPVSRIATTSPLRDGHLVVTSYDQESTTVSWHWPPAVICIALCREVGQEMSEDYKGLIEPSSNSVTKFTYEGLVPGRNYEFFIRRSDDNRLIKLSQRTVPSSPGTLTASALDAQSIRLDWSGAANDVERYEITTYPSDGGNGVQYVKMVAGSVFSTTIDGLIEDTNYTTEVRAISGSGESLEKSMPSTATTATEPIIMGVTLSLETVLPIRFSPISGTFGAYRYGYRKLPGDGLFSYTDLSKTVPPYFEIVELRPGALYEITLDTRNGSAYTEIDKIQARTIPSKPTLLTLTNLEDKSFSVNWTAPSLADVDFIGFYLSYEPLGSGITSPLFLDKTQTSQILTGLEPATNYNVTLVTVSGEGSSEQISFPETITATTAQGIPGGVNIREVTTSHIRISWNKVPGVYYYMPQINRNEGTVIYLEQEATCTFEGLTPGQLYTISIHWIGNSGPATQIYTKPKPPIDLTITRMAANELDISWRPPPDGLYDSYKLSYSQVLTNDITTIAVLSGDDPSVSLVDLKAETSYDVSVVSVRGTSVSEPLKTSGTTGRRVYDVLSLVDCTTTTITVRWGISTDASSEGYEIWIKPIGGVQKLVATLQLSTDTYTATNLTSGTTYVLILVITGLDRTEELHVTTYPLPPRIIHILSTTQTSITFSWERSGGNFDCYSIYFFMAGSRAAFLQDIPRWVNRTITKNFLTPGTTYKIQIYTKSGSVTSKSNEATASTDLEVLTFEPMSHSSVRISWENAVEAGQYSIEKTFLNNMVLGLFTTTERYLELNDTIPGQPYNFRLSSEETVGTGLIAEATYLLAPLPPSLTVRKISPTSVHVKITADPLGVVDHFVGDVSTQLTSLDTSQRHSTAFEIPAEACPGVTLTDLIPGSAYSVKVKAVSGESSSTATRTNISLGTLTPGEVFLSEKTSTAIEVFWGAVTGMNFKNYVVYLLNGPSRQQTQQHGINQEHKALFEGLLPGTLYTIALLLEFDGGGLIQQSILSVTTVPEAPKNLSLFVLGSEITLSWLPVTSNIGHYELCWTPFNQVRHVSGDSSQEVIILQPVDAQYTISLYSVIGDGDDRTRSSNVPHFITVLKDENSGSPTEAATSYYYVIGIVLGLIILFGCAIGTFLRVWKRKKAEDSSDWYPWQEPDLENDMNSADTENHLYEHLNRSGSSDYMIPRSTTTSQISSTMNHSLNSGDSTRQKQTHPALPPPPPPQSIMDHSSNSAYATRQKQSQPALPPPLPRRITMVQSGIYCTELPLRRAKANLTSKAKGKQDDEVTFGQPVCMPKPEKQQGHQGDQTSEPGIQPDDINVHPTPRQGTSQPFLALRNMMAGLSFSNQKQHYGKAVHSPHPEIELEDMHYGPPDDMQETENVQDQRDQTSAQDYSMGIGPLGHMSEPGNHEDQSDQKSEPETEQGEMDFGKPEDMLEAEKQHDQDDQTWEPEFEHIYMSFGQPNNMLEAEKQQDQNHQISDSEIEQGEINFGYLNNMLEAEKQQDQNDQTSEPGIEQVEMNFGQPNNMLEAKKQQDQNDQKSEPGIEQVEMNFGQPNNMLEGKKQQDQNDQTSEPRIEQGEMNFGQPNNMLEAQKQQDQNDHREPGTEQCEMNFGQPNNMLEVEKQQDQNDHREPETEQGEMNFGQPDDMLEAEDQQDQNDQTEPGIEQGETNFGQPVCVPKPGKQQDQSDQTSEPEIQPGDSNAHHTQQQDSPLPIPAPRNIMVCSSPSCQKLQHGRVDQSPQQENKQDQTDQTKGPEEEHKCDQFVQMSMIENEDEHYYHYPYHQRGSREPCAVFGCPAKTSKNEGLKPECCRMHNKGDNELDGFFMFPECCEDCNDHSFVQTHDHSYVKFQKKWLRPKKEVSDELIVKASKLLQPNHFLSLHPALGISYAEANGIRKETSYTRDQFIQLFQQWKSTSFRTEPDLYEALFKADAGSVVTKLKSLKICKSA